MAAAPGAVGAAFPANEVGGILQNILNLTAQQANTIPNNGWVALNDFERYTTSDIETWTSSIGRVAVNRGGGLFPSVRVRHLCALNHWVNRRILRGVPLVAVEFTTVELRTAMANYPIHDQMREANPMVDKPDRFNYDKWVDWQDSMVTYLKGRRNITRDIPLYYIIRPDTAPLAPTQEEQIVFNAPHTGAAYDNYNSTVHQILTELVNRTDADHWIKQHRRAQNGRAAWLALCAHYDGPAEGDKRVTVARHDIKVLHYKNESSFSFEKYSTRLKRAFTMLEQYNQPKGEREKVKILLGQINTNNMQFTSDICICRDSHLNTFNDACTYMSRQIATIFPQNQPNLIGKKAHTGCKPTYRGVNAIKTTKNGKVICNGVDLTDTTKYFNKNDYQKMGKEGHDYLNKCPKRKAAKEAHESKKLQKKTDDSDCHVAAIINGVMQATHNENDSVAGSTE